MSNFRKRSWISKKIDNTKEDNNNLIGYYFIPIVISPNIYIYVFKKNFCEIRNRIGLR